MNSLRSRSSDMNNQIFESTDNIKVVSKDGKYIINTPKGIIILNQTQYNILLYFSKSPRTIQQVVGEFPNLKKESILKLLDILIFEKLLFDVRQNKIRRKSIKFFIDLVTKFSLPKDVFIFIEEKLFLKINLNFMKVFSLGLLILAIFLNVHLIKYSDFSWSNTPRIFLFFIIGFFIASIHELWLGYFVIKSGGTISDFKLRVIFGVFATVAVNWKPLLLLGKKDKIKVFLYTDLFTSAICSLFSVIGYIYMKFDNKDMALTFCSFSIIGFSYLAINLWPFLFKGDGYSIYCFATGTSRLKSHFFRLLYYKCKSQEYFLVQKNKTVYYYIWGSIFILILIILQVALILGIRLRI